MEFCVTFLSVNVDENVNIIRCVICVFTICVKIYLAFLLTLFSKINIINAH